jgi:NAD(P)-dependent dehydrogenase (short-subunit alcohol dehydrogenase family)
VKLDGRVAIVTRGGGAIGAAVARCFDDEGATVVVADVRADAAEAVAGGLRQGVPLTLDVTASIAWSGRKTWRRAFSTSHPMKAAT